MGLFKKKTVPDELPELALDDAESQDKEVHDFLEKEEAKKPSVSESKDKKDKESESKTQFSEDKKDKVSKVQEPVKEIAKPVVETKEGTLDVKEDNSREKTLSEKERSFFSELKNDLDEGVTDSGQLEKWYKRKFEEGDVVKDMKNYWKDQKTSVIMKILGKNLQEKISKKISELEDLEKSWQEVYFDLAEKEEQIREQEIELKELLSEFVSVCKKNPKFSKPKNMPKPKPASSMKSIKPQKNKTPSKSKAKNKRNENEKRKKTN